jgi:hypothetical protein
MWMMTLSMEDGCSWGWGWGWGWGVNTAWLSLFQKQKDMLESGQQMQNAQSLMTQEFINRMVSDLIQMCDTVEKHGLVDYQYGVEEELITIGSPHIFPWACLELIILQLLWNVLTSNSQLKALLNVVNPKALVKRVLRFEAIHISLSGLYLPAKRKHICLAARLDRWRLWGFHRYNQVLIYSSVPVIRHVWRL